jgi:hypothetical protein
MAAGDVDKQNHLSLVGMDAMCARVELAGTETTAVEFDTGFRAIENVQLTLEADGTPTEASSVFISSISDGVITIDSTHALTGTNYVNVLVLGYRG